MRSEAHSDSSKIQIESRYLSEDLIGGNPGAGPYWLSLLLEPLTHSIIGCIWLHPTDAPRRNAENFSSQSTPRHHQSGEDVPVARKELTHTPGEHLSNWLKHSRLDRQPEAIRQLIEDEVNSWIPHYAVSKKYQSSSLPPKSCASINRCPLTSSLGCPPSPLYIASFASYIRTVILAGVPAINTSKSFHITDQRPWTLGCSASSEQGIRPTTTQSCLSRK